uniref:Uncharacterized protein n=1 Tax=Canis lupus dingo TaxID=286419 RepID=A0A8C0LJ56_CANLU
MALAAVKWVISNRTIWKHLFPTQNRALYFYIYNYSHHAVYHILRTHLINVSLCL